LIRCCRDSTEGAIKITPHIAQIQECFQVVLDVSNGRAILI
jgi:hypothetical protein